MSYLVKCAVCGGGVSSSAAFCPHCGEPKFMPKKPAHTLSVKLSVIGLPDFIRLQKRTIVDNVHPWGRKYLVACRFSETTGNEKAVFSNTV